MEREKNMRSELISLLSGGNAHDSWKTKLESWPEGRINLPLPGGKTPNALTVEPLGYSRTHAHLPAGYSRVHPQPGVR